MSASAVSPRRATFITLRIAGLLTGTGAVAIGVGYLIAAAVGPEVWWFGGGPLASGAIVTFPLPLRLVNAGAILLWCLTIAGMAFVLAALARGIRTEVRFARAVSRSAWALAIVLAVGSTAAQVVQNIATGSALVIDDGMDPANPIGAPIGWGVGTAVLMPNVPLLALSVVLAVLASVISAGERLQHDADGLV